MFVVFKILNSGATVNLRSPKKTVSHSEIVEEFLTKNASESKYNPSIYFISDENKCIIPYKSLGKAAKSSIFKKFSDVIDESFKSKEFYATHDRFNDVFKTINVTICI